MRPGASRLYLAAVAFGALAVSAVHVSAAPGAARSSLAFPAVGYGHAIARPGLARQFGYGSRLGFGARTVSRNGFGRGLNRGRGGRFGYGYGYGYGGYGLPIGYGYGPWAGEGGAAVIEQEPCRCQAEWPTAIGIPPSPVQPPAIYVIGGQRRGAASLRRPRTTSSMGVSGGASASYAAAPRFITVPSGR